MELVDSSLTRTLAQSQAEPEPSCTHYSYAARLEFSPATVMRAKALQKKPMRSLFVYIAGQPIVQRLKQPQPNGETGPLASTAPMDAPERDSRNASRLDLPLAFRKIAPTSRTVLTRIRLSSASCSDIPFHTHRREYSRRRNTRWFFSD